MKTCYLGHVIPDGFDYCWACEREAKIKAGKIVEPLVEKYFCINCGHELVKRGHVKLTTA